MGGQQVRNPGRDDPAHRRRVRPGRPPGVCPSELAHQQLLELLPDRAGDRLPRCASGLHRAVRRANQPALASPPVPARPLGQAGRPQPVPIPAARSHSTCCANRGRRGSPTPPRASAPGWQTQVGHGRHTSRRCGRSLDRRPSVLYDLPLAWYLLLATELSARGRAPHSCCTVPSHPVHRAGKGPPPGARCPPPRSLAGCRTAQRR